MLVALRSVASLLLAAFLLILGNGLTNILLPIRMGVEGLATEVAGLVMSAYYAGLLLGCLFGRLVIERVGHIRAFAAFAAVVCAAAVMYPLWFHPVYWAGLRVAGGFGMAALFATIESWLNDRAANEARGRIFSVYMAVAYLASGGGQFLVNGYDVRGLELFSLAAMLLCLSLVPVALTRQTGPDIAQARPLPFRELYRISPLGIAGCLGGGLLSGAYYSMAPLFGHDIGLSVFGVSVLMGVTVLGGLTLQWPIGRLSDKLDRRTVLLFVLIGVTLVCLAQYGQAFLPLHAPALHALSALYGGFSATIYPIAVSHAFDYVDKSRMVAASSGMLLAWAIGSTAGPLLASVVMAHTGPWSLYLVLAAVSGLMAGFTRYRMRRRAALPAAEQAAFVPRAETPIVRGALDPRTAGTE
ncbi:MAG: MFS transporter [Rhodospirillaceae bacterium]|nr:MFS transporter [Rhodospirillaceae bacterium]